MEQYKVLFMPKWYPNKFDPQAGIFVRKHAQAAARYHKVAVLYVSSDAALQQGHEVFSTDENDIPEISIYYKRALAPVILKKVINFYRYWKANKIGYELIEQQFGKPDLVHVNVLTRPGLFAYFLKKTKKIPYLITDHWSGYIEKDFENKTAISKWITRKIAASAEIILPVSEALKAGMQRNGLKNKYEVVPNVVELQVPKESHIKKGKTIIVNISDLNDRIKNISGLLKAFKTVAPQRPQTELHIIGGSYDEEKLHELAKDMGLWEQQVFFHGTMKNEETLKFLANSDFLVVNSNVETFSVVTAEAMACGKPVIATRCGGPEQFINEQTGILIDKNDQQQLEQALLQMIDHHKDYDPQSLKDHIGSRLSSDSIGRKLDGIYRRILNKKG